MNKEKIVWGVALFGVGLILLLDNLGVIDFYWGSVFRLWPVILIVLGLNMLMPRSGAGSVLTLLVTIAAFVFLAYAGTTGSRYDWWRFSQKEVRWQDSDGQPDSAGRERRVIRNQISHEYAPSILTASLSIKGGAVEYEINEPIGDHLFWSETESVFGAHHLDFRERDSSAADLVFRMKDARIRNWNLKNDKNEAKIRLHADPVWSIDLEMGAGTADFDLRKYKISRLTMECGAAAIKARLGRPAGHSEVRVESGAASVKIEVPQSAACRILVSSALSSRDFKGFTKQSDGSYATPGYDQATDRYTIRLEGGVSSFTVERKAD